MDASPLPETLRLAVARAPLTDLERYAILAALEGYSFAYAGRCREPQVSRAAMSQAFARARKKILRATGE